MPFAKLAVSSRFSIIKTILSDFALFAIVDNELKSIISDAFIFSFLIVALLYSLQIKKDKPPKRKYLVKLESTTRYYEYDCDSIIRISDKRIKLKNNEDSIYFIDIIIPDETIIQVCPK